MPIGDQPPDIGQQIHSLIRKHIAGGSLLPTVPTEAPPAGLPYQPARLSFSSLWDSLPTTSVHLALPAGKSKVLLCMVCSDQDTTTAEAFTLAQEADPEGRRTLGVFTKIDK